MRRLETVEELRSIAADDWPVISAKACRIALNGSGLDDDDADDCLRWVEDGRLDETRAALMRALAERLDAAAWDAEESGDRVRYLALFAQARAASALAFALSEEHDEAIYEAAHVFENPGDLVHRLSSA